MTPNEKLDQITEAILAANRKVQKVEPLLEDRQNVGLGNLVNLTSTAGALKAQADRLLKWHGRHEGSVAQQYLRHYRDDKKLEAVDEIQTEALALYPGLIRQAVLYTAAKIVALMTGDLVATETVMRAVAEWGGGCADSIDDVSCVFCHEWLGLLEGHTPGCVVLLALGWVEKKS